MWGEQLAIREGDIRIRDHNINELRCNQDETNLNKLILEIIGFSTDISVDCSNQNQWSKKRAGNSSLGRESYLGWDWRGEEDTHQKHKKNKQSHLIK